MLRLLRLMRIVMVAYRYGLDQIALANLSHPALVWMVKAAAVGRRLRRPRAERLRLALEGLGPLFVKFGQLLSTRRDLLPEDVADELARLQDRVPPFPVKEVHKIIEQQLGKPTSELFATFDDKAAAVLLLRREGNRDFDSPF